MELLLKVLLYGSLAVLGLFIFLIVIGVFSAIHAKRKLKLKKQKIKKEDRKLRKYLMDFKEDKLEIIDETPRELYIGDRFYILRPLKYRQFTRICIMFGKTLEKLQDLQIDVEDVGNHIGTIIEQSEDDFFKAIAYILYYSNNQEEDNDKNIIEGVEDEFLYLKNHAKLEEISRILEIIAVQNDVDRALKAFGVIAPKKKILQRK